jgi:excisionase family DNA binding protein
MLDKYLTTEQVAEILQVHPFTILKFIKNGKIKGVKLGRVYRINENDVKEFLESSTVRKTGQKEKSLKIETPESVEKKEPDKMETETEIEKETNESMHDEIYII